MTSSPSIELHASKARSRASKYSAKLASLLPVSAAYFFTTLARTVGVAK